MRLRRFEGKKLVHALANQVVDLICGIVRWTGFSTHLSTWVPVWGRDFWPSTEFAVWTRQSTGQAHDRAIRVQPLPVRHPNCRRGGEFRQLERRNRLEGRLGRWLVGHLARASARRLFVAESSSKHVLATFL